MVTHTCHCAARGFPSQVIWEEMEWKGERSCIPRELDSILGCPEATNEVKESWAGPAWGITPMAAQADQRPHWLGAHAKSQAEEMRSWPWATGAGQDAGRQGFRSEEGGIHLKPELFLVSGKGQRSGLGQESPPAQPAQLAPAGHQSARASSQPCLPLTVFSVVYFSIFW